MTGFEDCNFSRVAAHGPAKRDGGELVIAGGVCLGALGGVVGAANVGTACGSIPVWLDSSLSLALFREIFVSELWRKRRWQKLLRK